MEAGFASGPGLGEILQYLLELVLEKPEQNRKDRLLQEALRRYKISDSANEAFHDMDTDDII